MDDVEHGAPGASASAPRADAPRRLWELFPAPTPEEVAEQERQAAALLAAVNGATEEIEFVEYGGMYPEQGYGWWRPTGEAVYLRLRHDDASLEVGPSEDGRPMPARGRLRLVAELSGATGVPDAGSTFAPEVAAELVRTLRAMLDHPDPRPELDTQRVVERLRRIRALYER